MGKDVYINREIGKSLIKFNRQFPVLVISGPRQSGKTTLLRHLFGDNYKFVSFDDPLEKERALSDPRLFLENLGERVIFDEIQYVPELLRFIKIIVDRNRNKRGLFILTGSQQFTLIKNLTETLAGRCVLFNLLGFSRQERLSIPSVKRAGKDLLKDFVYASLRGSFPEICIHKDKEARVWYAAYLQTYLERDIRLIYDIGSIREFQIFIRLLASRCASILNLTSIANDIGVAVNTAKKWLSLLEATGLVYLLYPYYRNLGKRIVKAPKVYFLDSGLVCYLTGIDTGRQLMNSPLSGALFENYCIQETVKCFYNRGLRPNIFYLRTHNQLEVDLIIEQSTYVYPIEIKLAKTANVAMTYSIERFKKIFGKLDIQKGKIISLSADDALLTKNVSLVNIDTYLNWLENL